MQLDPFDSPDRERSLMHRVPGDNLFGRLSRMGTFPLVMLLLLLLGVAGLLQLADGTQWLTGGDAWVVLAPLPLMFPGSSAGPRA